MSAGKDLVDDRGKSLAKGWGDGGADGERISDFNGEDADGLRDVEAESPTQRKDFTDAKEMGGHFRQRFQFLGVDFVEEAGLGVTGLDRVHNQDLAIALHEIEQRETHFAGVDDVDVWAIGQAGADLPGDVETHAIIGEDVVAQAEDESLGTGASSLGKGRKGKAGVHLFISEGQGRSW